MKSTNTVEALRLELSRSDRPYPEELRARVVATSEREIGTGASLASVARAFGISALTLQLWRSARSGFARVDVVDAPQRPALRLVHERTGVVVEGLDVTTVIAVLRGLG